MSGTRSAVAALSPCALASAGRPTAAEFVVEPVIVNETKAVFGKVESRDAVPARARIGGTIREIRVDEGSEVAKGDVIAVIVDDKIALQQQAADAKIQALASQLNNAETDLARAEQLLKSGSTTQSRVDQARTQVEVLTNQLAAAEAERAVIAAQATEGEVVAPASGRVLRVPVTQGSVVLPGEEIALVAGGGYFLRLALPERHAAEIVEGAPVLVGDRPGSPRTRRATIETAGTGKLVKVYPQIEDGRVLADVEVDGLGDYFVGERTLVWIPVGKRSVLAVPPEAVVTRHGVDYVRLASRGRRNGSRRDPRRAFRGRRRSRGRGADRPEARRPGRSPMKLGIAGRLTASFINSPLTPLLLLASLALGLVALVTLPREEEPQISVPMVDIHVQADGLKAEDAVKLVTEPLETIVKSIDGVEHVYSQTTDDRAVVTARFLVGTSSDAAILRVHDKVRANIDRIPVGIPEPLIVGRGIDDVAIVVVTLTPKPEAAGRWDANGLTRLARELQIEVSKLPDIGLTYIVGAQPEADPGRARSRAPVPLRHHPAAARRQGRGRQPLLPRRQCPRRRPADRPRRRRNAADDARDRQPAARPPATAVRSMSATSPTSAWSPTAAETRVAEVRKAGDGLERIPAVSLAIAKRPGTNAVVIAEEIVSRLEAVSGQIFPEDVDMTVTRNYGETANEKANELLFHLGLATISIVILVAVAIGWREAIVVAIVIPTTILLTLFAARIMGYTLNRVSLFALIFSIGILVDDAIVVIENIARHWAMDDGRSRARAAIEAVAEVGNPTIVATLTVVAALLPMLFVSGLMGPYMSPIPAIASAAMLFSFFVAVMLTPWLMVRFGHGGEHEAGPRQDRASSAASTSPSPGRSCKSRFRSWLFLAIVGVLTVGSLALFYTQDVTVKLLPFDNKTDLQVVVDLPEGSSVEETDRVLQAAVERLADVPEVVSFQTYAGTAAPFNFNGLVRHYYLRAMP